MLIWSVSRRFYLSNLHTVFTSGPSSNGTHNPGVASTILYPAEPLEPPIWRYHYEDLWPAHFPSSCKQEISDCETEEKKFKGWFSLKVIVFVLDEGLASRRGKKDQDWGKEITWGKTFRKGHPVCSIYKDRYRLVVCEAQMLQLLERPEVPGTHSCL